MAVARSGEEADVRRAHELNTTLSVPRCNRLFPIPDVCYASAMQAVANKQRILDALESLADDASVEEAIERLYFLAKVERGLEQLDKGESIDHEEIKRRVGL
jgi:hypothetical protein